MEQEGELTFAATPQQRTSPRAAAAEAAAPSWADVPDNILVRVSAFLRCRAVRGVGRPLPPLPPLLPWLIFPNTETPTFYSPITRRYHRLRLLPHDVRAARFCGSGDGGWLVLAFGSRNGYALYNLDNGERIPLPPGFRTARNAQFPLVVRAATLSGAPSPDTPYMVAAIVLAASGNIAAFWSPGSESWFSPGGLRRMRPQDVIFFNGGFISVGANEGVITFWPVHGPQGNVSFALVDYDMQLREDYAEDLVFVQGHGMMNRYLVGSRGRLLMVVRYIYDDGTLTLRVFGLLVTAPATADVPRPRATWVNLGQELDGQMLFLGRGCSRSFEVADYEGFQDSMIYYLDEEHMVSGPLHGDRRLYSFTDTGRYDMDEVATAPWPEGLYPTTSDNAPPTWWLH
ncbi:hypothetical protein PAHAL_5G267400 [Panicum hallii]|uniref:KIB1-4 beta-propeller domain-containing protein n=1 Tax=Panicum hallii TaxID=206008 RepID=A0A2S3HUF4_9POAL|nr:hypothetical protein PAHAL_5G267400 [Panicum hallii]